MKLTSRPAEANRAVPPRRATAQRYAAAMAKVGVLKTSPFFSAWLVFLVALSMASIGRAQDRPFTVAVVEDGESDYYRRSFALIQEELERLLGDSARLRFKRDPAFSARWDPSRVSVAFEAAERDPEVDAILCMGLLASIRAASPDRPLRKPTLGGVIQDRRVVKLSVEGKGTEARCTKANLNLVVSPRRVADEIALFKRMVPFQRLHLVADSFALTGLDGLVDKMTAEIEEQLGITVVLVPTERDLSALWRGVEGAEAVYLTPAVRFSAKEREAMITGLIARRIPSFSMVGHVDVKDGVLAGLKVGSRRRLARRVALNLKRVMEGESPNSLSAYLVTDERLLINGRTASALRYDPPFRVLLEADVLHDEQLERGNPLTIEEATRLAQSQNPDLSVRRAELESAYRTHRRASTVFLPQVQGNFIGSQIDRERSRKSNGSAAERQASVGFTFSQLLFDDQAFTDYRAAKRVTAERRHTQEATRLDLVADTATAFIRLLSARASARIELNNLRLTTRNLELARLRREVGSGAPEEVFRWESQRADQRRAVERAYSRAGIALTELNRSMGHDPIAQWRPTDLEVDPDDTHFFDGDLVEFIKNQQRLDVFRDYVIAVAIANAPELKAFDERIEAQRLRIGQLRRRYYLPSVSAQFDYDYMVHRRFHGGNFPLARANRANWGLSLGLSIPLFEGTGRYHDVKRAEADLVALRGQRESSRQRIATRAQASVLAFGETYPAIRLTRQARDSAQKNLDVIRQKYTRGAVSILDLLDAQNQFFVLNQSAAVAAYEFLEDTIEFQRAMSWFVFEQSDEAYVQWMERLRSHRITGGTRDRAPSRGGLPRRP